ncbi:MAG: hypothetical protein H0W42_02130 [Gemmatimonadaceae bacterium]|nr:hypothetical protein [Gemmatimonadaceae bacterium]
MVPAFRSWRLAVAVVASLACGGGGGGGGSPTAPTPPGPGSPSTSASVAMGGGLDSYGYEVNAFAPSTVIIARNGTVTWSNPTGRMHNVTFSTAGAPANIADHGSGTNARTFATAGTFGFQCTNHSSMTGSVTVQ